MEVDVIGVGTVGGGITQASAWIDGYEAYLCNLTDAFARGGKKRIEKGLMGRIAKGRLSQEEMDRILSCIHTGTKDICKDCDLVVEITIGNIQIKKQTFKRLSEICKKDCLFATNTSSLSIAEIGAGPDYLMTGTHFFNPAPVMKLTKVISGLDTPQEDLNRITETVESIGKTVVPMQEFTGFVVNRILIPMISKAIGVYADNNVPAGKIDKTMKLGASHPTGPLALGDLIGLDVVLAIMGVLQSEAGDMRYRPHPELRKMIHGGRLGRKTGRGFCDYTE